MSSPAPSFRVWRFGRMTSCRVIVPGWESVGLVAIEYRQGFFPNFLLRVKCAQDNLGVKKFLGYSSGGFCTITCSMAMERDFFADVSITRWNFWFRVRRILDCHMFDGHVEELICKRFYNKVKLLGLESGGFGLSHVRWPWRDLLSNVFVKLLS